MQIKQNRFLLLLAFTVGIQFSGFSNSDMQRSVPAGLSHGRPVYHVKPVTVRAVIPEWWLNSTLEEVYEDEYVYYDSYRYKVVFDTHATGSYSIHFRVTNWTAGGSSYSSDYYSSASPGDLEVDLGVWERYYTTGTYWRDTDVSVISITE